MYPIFVYKCKKKKTMYIYQQNNDDVQYKYMHHYLQNIRCCYINELKNVHYDNMTLQNNK